MRRASCARGLERERNRVEHALASGVAISSESVEVPAL